MLLHTVMWRFKDAEGKTAAENRELVKQGLLALPQQVEALENIEFFENVVACARNFDAMLRVTVADEAALEAYKTHPAHQKVARYVHEVTTDRAAVDIFLD